MATPYNVTASHVANAATEGNPITSPTQDHDVPAPAATKEGTSFADTENGDKSVTPSDTLVKGGTEDEEYDDGAEMARRSSVVQALARTYSRASGAPGGNPFFADDDSPLNPNSDKFDGKMWAKAIVELVNQDGASFRSTGVAFQHLNVHGYGEGTDYQKDVANVWLSLGGMARTAVAGGKQRIDILQDFDGLVRNGEMLVVLGPPGSGCSTFLKTIAGEMNGIYVDDESYFNYQGMLFPIFFFLFPRAGSPRWSARCPPGDRVSHRMCVRAGTWNTTSTDLVAFHQSTKQEQADYL